MRHFSHSSTVTLRVKVVRRQVMKSLSLQSQQVRSTFQANAKPHCLDAVIRPLTLLSRPSFPSSLFDLNPTNFFEFYTCSSIALQAPQTESVPSFSGMTATHRPNISGLVGEWCTLGNLGVLSAFGSPSLFRQVLAGNKST